MSVDKKYSGIKMDEILCNSTHTHFYPTMTINCFFEKYQVLNEDIEHLKCKNLISDFYLYLIASISIINNKWIKRMKMAIFYLK